MRNWLLIPAVLVIAACDSATPEEHFARALEYIDSGQFNPAVIELKSTLQKAPDTAAARYRLGVLYESGGNYDSAVKELERALDLGFDRAPILPPLLRAKVQLGQYQEVLGALEQEAETPTLVAIKGLAHLRAGDVEAAVANFDLALQQDPRVVDAFIGRGYALTGRDPKSALAALQAALELDPGRREAWSTKGEIELGMQDDQAALESFRRVASLPGGEVSGAIGMVRAHLLRNSLDPAEQEVNELLRRLPNQPMGRYFKALIAFHRDDIDLAIDELRQVQRVIPDYLPAMFLMGTVQFRQGQMNQAETELARYVSRAPKGLAQNLSARKMLASIHLQRGANDEAIATLAAEVAALDAQGTAMLGLAHQRAGDHATASSYLQRAVEMAPSLAEFRADLAVSLMATGDERTAQDHLTKAIELDPQFIRSDELLVRLLLRRGVAEEAIAAAQALIEKDPGLPLGHNLLGTAHLAAGKRAAAAAGFEAALQREPNYTPALENLAQLAMSDGDRSTALKYFRALNEIEPGHEQSALLLAEETAASDPQRALSILRQVRSSNAGALRARIVLARSLMIDQQFAEADAVALEAMALAPNDPVVKLIKVQADAGRGRQETALRDLRALMRETDQLPRGAHILLARLEAAVGSAERGVVVLRDWLAANPEDLGAAITLAALEIPVDPASAQSRYEALNAAAPNDPVTLNNLAWLYHQSGDARAEAVARQAWAVAPGEPGIGDTLGWILLSTGKRQEALTLLRDALEASGGNPTIAYHLAVGLEQSGDREGAAEAAARSLESAASFPERAAAQELADRLSP